MHTEVNEAVRVVMVIDMLVVDVGFVAEFGRVIVLAPHAQHLAISLENQPLESSNARIHVID